MDDLTPEQIIELLEEPARKRRQAMSYIAAQASTTSISNALRLARKGLTQEILSDIAGERNADEAVPVLIEYLQNSTPSVRAAAADALGKIGDVRAGPMLMTQFDQLEKDTGVRHMLATALGACGYRKAIPLLIQALNDPDRVLRSCAAWALGALGAESAEDALRSVLQHEKDDFTREGIEQALNAITLVKRALQEEDRNSAVELLVSQLTSDTQFITSVAWALGKLGGREARNALIHTLVRITGEEKYVARRIEDALLVMEEK